MQPEANDLMFMEWGTFVDPIELFESHGLTNCRGELAVSEVNYD